MSTVKNEKAMASNLATTVSGEPDDDRDDDKSAENSSQNSPDKSTSQDKLIYASGRRLSSAGFFTIQKYGQGKWTRLGTILVAGLLGVMTSYNIDQWVIAYWPWTNQDPGHHEQMVKQIALGVSILFLVGFSALVFRLTNKPGNVDFLIATDSEMKKVNWTTKGELMGSTRVVVLFLFFIAIFLFVVDLIFSAFFQLIGVLLKANS